MRKLTESEILNRISGRPIVMLSKYTSIHDKQLWKCKSCLYEWSSTTASIIHSKTGCPKCAGRANTLSDIKSLAKDRNFELVSDYFINMTTKLEWKCQDGHIWKATPHKIKNGSGCPHCTTYRGEAKCRFIFEQLTGKSFPKLRNAFNSGLELDGYCRELNIAFEYNGKHHYERVKYWHKTKQDFINQIERDNKKAEVCKNNNVDLVVISYNIKDLKEEVKKSLQSLNMKYQNYVNWNKFNGSALMLEELKSASKNIKLECLEEVYISARHPMKFKCKKCDRIFKSTSNDVKNGYGCLKCSGKMKLTINEVRKRGKKVGLKLLSSEYINAKTKLEWKCQKCSETFWRTPSDVQQGKGCSLCGIKQRTKSRHLLTIP